jgi:hypothetical protein
MLPVAVARLVTAMGQHWLPLLVISTQQYLVVLGKALKQRSLHALPEKLTWNAAFVAAADAVNNAADPDGLTLYAAIKTEPLVSDLPGRAMQLVTVLREFRGSAHLLALRAMGIDSKTAHFVKRPNDVKMFGWTEADAPVIDDDLRARMVAAEELTDKLVAPAYGVLNAQERKDFLAGAQAIAAALAS